MLLRVSHRQQQVQQVLELVADVGANQITSQESQLANVSEISMGILQIINNTEDM